MSTVFLMYHFVLSADPSPFDGLKGVSITEFREQLAWLCRHMQPLTHDDLLRIAADRRPMPDRHFHLSFDDGTRDHLDQVFPILQEMGLTGNFYPVTQPLVEGRVLLMEKQRYLHYVAYPDYEVFLNTFYEMILRHAPDIDPAVVKPSQENYEAAGNYLAEFDFYSLEERFYRRVRNDVLSPAQFSQIVDAMFADFYPDEDEFIRQFYMTFEDLRAMKAEGMTIGGHTHSHPFLSQLTAQDTAREIGKSLSTLGKELGAPIQTYAYPYGDFAEVTLQVLASHGIPYALATGNKVSGPNPNILAIPRVDAASFDRVKAVI